MNGLSMGGTNDGHHLARRADVGAGEMSTAASHAVLRVLILGEPVVYRHHRAKVVGRYGDTVLVQYDAERTARPAVVHLARPGEVMKDGWGREEE